MINITNNLFSQVRKGRQKKAPIISQGLLKSSNKERVLPPPVSRWQAVDVFTCFNINKVGVSVFFMNCVDSVFFPVKVDAVSFHNVPPINYLPQAYQTKLNLSTPSKSFFDTLLSIRQLFDRASSWAKRLLNRGTWAGLALERGRGVGGSCVWA